MNRNFLYLTILVIFFFAGCEKSAQDFRLELIGDYSLHQSCVQETEGKVVWEADSELIATISIPLSSQHFEGFNPPDYIKLDDRALQIDLYPENGNRITYYLWVNPQGEIKEAIFDPHHIITGKVLPGSFEMTICDCGGGSQINCTYD